jgi:hypothetical protein
MPRPVRKLVVCLNNKGYEASLERRKLYIAISDTSARKLGLIRVVDESGNDYLFAQEAFREISLPRSLRQAVMRAC